MAGATGKLTGIVRRLGEVETNGDYKKRDLIITVDADSEYPQHINIEVPKQKVDDDKLKEIRPGDTITVDFNFRGREWTNPKDNKVKVFNTLAYWKLSIDRTASTADINQAAQQQAAASAAPPKGLGDGFDDDLPF